MNQDKENQEDANVVESVMDQSDVEGCRGGQFQPVEGFEPHEDDSYCSDFFSVFYVCL